MGVGSSSWLRISDFRAVSRVGLIVRPASPPSEPRSSTPGKEGSKGRDHHPYGFSCWLAGGGLKGGRAHGATDEIGIPPPNIATTSPTSTPPC